MADFLIDSTERLISFDGTGFDATRAAFPATVTVLGATYMYYGGLPFSNRLSIGLATSDDNQNFSKYSDNALISYSGSTPFTSMSIRPERVFYNDETGLWTMYFWGQDKNLITDNGTRGFGIGTSSDGINWSMQQQPLLSETGPGQGFTLEEMVKVEGGFVAYLTDISHPNASPKISFSSDGVNFSPLTNTEWEFDHRLQTATEYGDGVLGIFRTDTENVYRTGYSEDGINFTYGGTFETPGPIGLDEINVVGDQVEVLGSVNVGNVNWNFGNLVVERFSIPLSLFDAPPIEPEPESFEFNVHTAMQLAAAAYAPIEDNPEGPSTDTWDEEEGVYGELFDGSTDLEIVSNFSLGGELLTDSKGFFVNQNAAALVARTEDTLIISFRGTNDNEDLIANVVQEITQTPVFAVVESLVHVLARPLPWFIERFLQRVLDRAVDRLTNRAEQIQSPDVADWFDLSGHFALFDELMQAIPALLDDHGLTDVKFTGHSLGGSMVQNAMIVSPVSDDGPSYQGYAFAPPGIDLGNDEIDDSRLLNVTFESDFIRTANLLTDRTGDTLILDSGLDGGHDTSLYLKATERLLAAGFETGNRLASPTEDGEPLGDGFKRIEVSMKDDGDGNIIVGLDDEAGVGTNGDDNIVVNSLGARGAVVAGLEGDDSVDLVGSSFGADTFVFRNGDGHDVVSGFNITNDRLALYGFADPTDYTFTVIDGLFSDEVTLTWDTVNSITFTGVDGDAFVNGLADIILEPTDDLQIV